MCSKWLRKTGRMMWQNAGCKRGIGEGINAIWFPPGGGHGGLMVSVLDFGLKGPGSNPRQKGVVFLGKTLYLLLSHSGSLHPETGHKCWPDRPLSSYADYQSRWRAVGFSWNQEYRERVLRWEEIVIGPGCGMIASKAINTGLSMKEELAELATREVCE